MKILRIVETDKGFHPQVFLVIEYLRKESINNTIVYKWRELYIDHGDINNTSSLYSQPVSNEEAINIIERFKDIFQKEMDDAAPKSLRIVTEY